MHDISLDAATLSFITNVFVPMCDACMVESK